MLRSFKVVAGVLVLATLLSACSSQPQQSGKVTVENKCLRFNVAGSPDFRVINGHPYTPDGGQPIAGGVTVACETQIAPIQEPWEYLEASLGKKGYKVTPGGDTNYVFDDQIQAPDQIYWEQLDEPPQLLEPSHLYIIPSQTAQCRINKFIVPAFKCKVDIGTLIELSTFKGWAWELQGGVSVPEYLPGLTFTGGHSSKTTDTLKVEAQHPFTLWSGMNKVWSGVLVKSSRYEKKGEAKVCYEADKKCLRAHVDLKETVTIAYEDTVGSWDSLLTRLQHLGGQTLTVVQGEPQVTDNDVSLFFQGGPLTSLLGNGLAEVKFKWTQQHAVLGQTNLGLEAQITIPTDAVEVGVGGKGSYEQGHQRLTQSTIELSYDTGDPFTKSMREVHVWKVGENPNTDPKDPARGITGLILGETTGCPPVGGKIALPDYDIRDCR